MDFGYCEGIASVEEEKSLVKPGSAGSVLFKDTELLFGLPLIEFEKQSFDSE
jgi:hypothetical protein